MDVDNKLCPWAKGRAPWVDSPHFYTGPLDCHSFLDFFFFFFKYFIPSLKIWESISVQIAAHVPSAVLFFISFLIVCNLVAPFHICLLPSTWTRKSICHTCCQTVMSTLVYPSMGPDVADSRSGLKCLKLVGAGHSQTRSFIHAYKHAYTLIPPLSKLN